MNKTELIAAVAEKAGLTKKDVEKAISATLETVKEEVAKGGKVQVVSIQGCCKRKIMMLKSARLFSRAFCFCAIAPGGTT